MSTLEICKTLLNTPVKSKKEFKELLDKLVEEKGK